MARGVGYAGETLYTGVATETDLDFGCIITIKQLCELDVAVDI